MNINAKPPVDMLAAALAYAQMGIAVFPCKSKSKLPATKHGFKDATTDPNQIETWWRQNPQFNIGIATGAVSQLLVLDVDPRNGGDIDTLQNQFGDLPETPIVITGGGGRQYYLAHPGGNIACSSGKLAPGIDVKADGGYVVAPPSIHPSGIAYGWDDSATLGDVWPGSCPAWLVKQLAKISEISPHGPTSCEPASDPIPPGQRNSTLASIAGHLRRAGLSGPAIEAALLTVNRERCQPPLGETEISRIAASVSRYDPDSVTVALVENHYDQMMGGEKPTNAAPLPDPGPLPEKLLRIPGFVGELMDYCLATAPYPNPVMAFCGALSLQAFLAGRKVRDSGDNRTNIYLLGLAHSAAGKDWPRKINTRIAHEIGMAHSLGERFASGEGIQDALFGNPSMLFQTDEIDGILQSINKSKDARHENIMSTLLTMYSSSNSVFPMRRKAGKESPGVIDQPSLVIFGTAIPNHYYEALSDRMLTNGFFARMIILESGNRGKGQEPCIRELPPRILATATWWSEYQPGKGNLEHWHPIPTIVEYTPDAHDLLTATRDQADSEYKKAEAAGDPVGTTVWGRVSEQVRKLALLYAVSENHTSPQISLTAVQWASMFILHQTRRMLFMAQSHVADNPFHADCLKLMQKLREALGCELSHSVLLKRMKMDAKTFNVLVETLAQQGDIEIRSEPRAGSYKRSYRLVQVVKCEGETTRGGEM